MIAFLRPFDLSQEFQGRNLLYGNRSRKNMVALAGQRARGIIEEQTARAR